MKNDIPCVYVNDCVCSPLMELIAEAHLALLWIMLRFITFSGEQRTVNRAAAALSVAQDRVYTDISVHLTERTKGSKILINRSFSQDYSCTECWFFFFFQACFQTHEMTLNAIYVQGSHCGPSNVLTSVSFEGTVEFTMSVLIWLYHFRDESRLLQYP